MELLDRLEKKLENLILKIRDLEEENSSLRTELAQVKRNQAEVLDRIDHLLKKVQEVDID